MRIGNEVPTICAGFGQERKVDNIWKRAHRFRKGLSQQQICFFVNRLELIHKYLPARVGIHKLRIDPVPSKITASNVWKSDRLGRSQWDGRDIRNNYTDFFFEQKLLFLFDQLIFTLIEPGDRFD